MHCAVGGGAGLVSAFGFAPLGLWPCVGIGLAALFAVESRAGARRGAITGALYFGVFSLVHNSWVALFGAPALIGLTLVMAGLGALQGSVGAALARCSPRLAPLGPALAWVLVEAVRMRFPFGGFAWGIAAHALAGTPLRHLAPLGGPLLMGAALAAAAIALAAVPMRPTRSRAAVLSGASLALVALPGPMAGLLPTRTHPAGIARIAVVQAYYVDRDPTLEEVEQRTFLRAHLRETARLPKDLDLVAWGESSVDDPGDDNAVGAALAGAARDLGAPILVNAPVLLPGDPSHLLNTSFLYGPSGRVEATYTKRHLVPFGEYVPFRRWLGWVNELERVPLDHLPGTGSGVLRSEGLAVGNLICFESVDLGLARRDVSDGAELIVVTTNNRSFSRSPLSRQHIETSRVLALSTGRTVVHAAVSGASAVILPSGDVVARAPLFAQETIQATVPLQSGRTPYVVLGDWIALVALAISLGLAANRVRRTKD